MIIKPWLIDGLDQAGDVLKLIVGQGMFLAGIELVIGLVDCLQRDGRVVFIVIWG